MSSFKSFNKDEFSKLVDDKGGRAQLFQQFVDKRMCRVVFFKFLVSRVLGISPKQAQDCYGRVWAVIDTGDTSELIFNTDVKFIKAGIDDIMDRLSLELKKKNLQTSVKLKT